MTHRSNCPRHTDRSAPSHRTAFVLLAIVALLATSCGDDSSTAANKARQQIEDAQKDGNKKADEILKNIDKAIGGGDVEMKEVDSTVRFLNLYSDGGTPKETDLWFGSGQRGEKAATLAYGKITDPIKVKVDTKPLFTPGDGSTELVFSFYVPGKSDIQDQQMSITEKLKDGNRYLIVLTSDSSPSMSGRVGMTTTVITENKFTPPPSGSAALYINTNGVQAIENGSFVVPELAGSCAGLPALEIEGTGNAGTASGLTPGPVSLRGTDANTDCATTIGPVDIDATAGSSYLMVAYGTTVNDRKIQVVELDT